MSKDKKSVKAIAKKKKQAKALSKTLARENDVFLDYCTDLIEIALNTMAALGADQDAGKEAVAATADELKAGSQEALKKSLDEANQASSAHAENSSAGGADEFDAAMNNSMANAVNAQQQMNVIANAATAQLINTIITLGSAEIGNRTRDN